MPAASEARRPARAAHQPDLRLARIERLIARGQVALRAGRMREAQQTTATAIHEEIHP